MRKNQEQKREDMTLRSLKRRLRHLPEVEVPGTLESRLFAMVPDRGAKVAREEKAKRHPEARSFGVAAAAAVLILALMLALDYGFSTHGQVLFAEIYDDTSLCYPTWEQANIPYDQNNGCVERTLPRGLKWPMICPNEAGY
jgi:hypothetical protein